MPPRIYPTVAETIEAHRLLIEEFGGLHGIRDTGLLESAVLRPQSGCYGNFIEEASALKETLANTHGVIQGNRRVSIVLTAAMRQVSDYVCDVGPFEGD